MHWTPVAPVQGSQRPCVHFVQFEEQHAEMQFERNSLENLVEKFKFYFSKSNLTVIIKMKVSNNHSSKKVNKKNKLSNK